MNKQQELVYYPIRPIQRWMIDTHLYRVESTMMNMGGLLKLDDMLDMERLSQAVRDTLDAHDIFRSRFTSHLDTDDIYMYFVEEKADIRVEVMSDQAFDSCVRSLKIPYQLMDHRLYSIRLIETPTRKYFYVDFYHGIMDGVATSRIFMREVQLRYCGKHIGRDHMSYGEYLLWEKHMMQTTDFTEGHIYWGKIVEQFHRDRHLPKADVNGVKPWTEGFADCELDQVRPTFFGRTKCDEQVFFLTASMLTLALLTGQTKSVMSWVHHGRTTATESRICGIMLEQLPICWLFQEGDTVGETLTGVGRSVEESMKERRSLNEVYVKGQLFDFPEFIYQKGIYNSRKLGDKEWELVELPLGETDAVENSIDIEVIQTNDGSYCLELDYDASRYSLHMMTRFGEIMNRMCRDLQDEERPILDLLKEI